MPFYDYECEAMHRTERYFSVEEKPFAIRCPKCRGEALQIIVTAPALHTLGTFSKDIDDRGVQATRDPGDGSYADPNIFDRKTGKHPRIKSPKHRAELLRSMGLHEKDPSDQAKDVARSKQKRAIHFDSRRTANG